MTLPPQALASGELHVLGRLAEASNLALLAEISTETGPLRCIYKPVSGERPLWDFPGAALAAREVLTAEVADCFGWDLIPPTTWREEGPFGAGMCQAWVEVVDDDPVALFPSGSVPEGWYEIAGVTAQTARRSCWPMSPARSCSAWSSWTPWSTTPTARAVTSCAAPTDRSPGSTTA